jgi:poly(hydroxyalkanoate) granule-associated protein
MSQTTNKKAQTPLLKESIEQVWLAGLGALAFTEEEGEKFFRSLVKKGESVEHRTKERLDDMFSAAKQVPATALTRMEKEVDVTIETVKHRLGMPTRAEMNGLNRRIENLTRTVEKKTTAKRGMLRRGAVSHAEVKKESSAISHR